MPKLNLKDIADLKDDTYPKTEKMRRKKPKKEGIAKNITKHKQIK